MEVWAEINLVFGGGWRPSEMDNMTLDELDAAREWMLLLGRKTAREKIASMLAMISDLLEKSSQEQQMPRPFVLAATA